MGKPQTRFSLLFLITACFLLLGSYESIGSTITIKAGKFNHFTLHIPPTQMAGESFGVRLQAYDIYNNLITDFNETGRDFEIKVSGSAQVEPKVLRASNFQGGSAVVNVKDKKAERITLSISEMGGTVPIIAKEVIIMPNRADHFALQAPSQVKAGETFDIRVIARDAYENIVVDDAGIGKDLKINIGGTSSLKSLDMGGLNFKGGVANIRFLSEKTGEAIIEIYDSHSGSKGKSTAIKIVPAGLGSFSVQIPKEAVAGEPFEVTIAPLDSYGNPIANYNATGDGVVLSSTGKGRLLPDRISPSEFKSGHAVTKVTYEIAEDIEVLAKESNKKESGKGGPVRIRPAAPDHFVVITPETASAGQSFKVRIESYDRFNNPVRDYNLVGSNVYIGTTGSGLLTPSLIPSSEFINGIAVVDAIYDKAESFSVTARMTHKKDVIKTEVKKEESVKKPKEKKIESLPPKKGEESKRVPSDIKEKPKSELKSKAETKEKVANKPVEAKKAESAKVAQKAVEAKKVEETIKTETKKAAKKPEEVKKVEEVKKPEPKKAAEKPVEAKKPEPKKEIEKTDVSPKPYVITDIGIVESKKKAIFIIASSGPLDHKTSLITKDGGKWLNLKISPAVRKIEKTQRLKSSFIGDVIIGEEDGNTLSILLEILAEPVTYKVKSTKDSIVVTFTTN